MQTLIYKIYRVCSFIGGKKLAKEDAYFERFVHDSRWNIEIRENYFHFHLVTLSWLHCYRYYRANFRILLEFYAQIIFKHFERFKRICHRKEEGEK